MTTTSSTKPMRVRVIGPGRAGRSFAKALSEAGAEVDLIDRNAPIAQAAVGTDVVLICTPDAGIGPVAETIRPGGAAVLHCSGATTLAPLAAHARRGSVHPLMALPDAETGARRLAGGGWFATAGDPAAASLVELLGGRAFPVPDERRAIYHATAAVAANHLVALLGQVERLAGHAQVPVEAFLDLAAGSFDDVRAMGAMQALTGPASRRDHATLDAHRRALPSDELELYDALVEAATRLVDARDSSARPDV